MTGDEALSESSLPSVGEVLASKYRLERCIGRGGMGAVFQARHEILGQPVAIKLLLPEVAADQAAVTRFLNEARASAQIRNEHVARVLDVDTLPNGSAFMVLEFLEGADLATLLVRQGPLSVSEAAGFILQALEAIAQAHALGIVHRDLKPANLFLAHRPDGTSIIKVLDFGISKAASTQDSALTGVHSMLGSPSFMSPEQARSARSVDARSDLWSIGVCLHQVLTGELPFKGDNIGEVYAAVLEARPLPASKLNAAVPGELDEVIARCLQRDLEKRFQTTVELAEALAPFAPEPERGAVERIRRSLAGAPSPSPESIGVGAATVLPAAPPPTEASAVTARTAPPTADEQDEETHRPFTSPFAGAAPDQQEEATFKPFTSPFAVAAAAPTPASMNDEPAATTPGMPAFILGEEEVTVRGPAPSDAQAVAEPRKKPLWFVLAIVGAVVLAGGGLVLWLVLAR